MSGQTALIIDDEKNIRLTLSKCLSFLKLNVDEAINGEEGLKKISEKKYDIVFLDLKMQGMSGLEALKKIKDIDPDASVVIITAHGTVDVAVEAMKLGASDFMQKPFTPQEIQEIVKEIIARKNLDTESLNSYDSCLNFAKEQISKMNYEVALDYLKKAVGLSPTQAEPHNLLGAVMEIKEDYEEAKKHYKTALALDPDYLQAETGLIRINEKLKSSKK